MKKKMIIGIAIIFLVVLMLGNLIKNKIRYNSVNIDPYKGIERIEYTKGTSSVYSKYIIDTDGNLECEYFSSGRIKKISKTLNQNEYIKILNMIKDYKVLSWCEVDSKTENITENSNNSIFDETPILNPGGGQIGGSSIGEIQITFKQDTENNSLNEKYSQEDKENFCRKLQKMLDRKSGMNIEQTYKF